MSYGGAGYRTLSTSLTRDTTDGTLARIARISRRRGHCSRLHAFGSSLACWRVRLPISGLKLQRQSAGTVRKRRYILTASALPLLKPRLPAARSGAGAPLLSCPAFRVPVLPMWTGAGLPRQEVSEGERVSRSESPLSPPATAGAQRLAAFRAPVAVRSPPATPATSRLRLPQVV